MRLSVNFDVAGPEKVSGAVWTLANKIGTDSYIDFSRRNPKPARHIDADTQSVGGRLGAVEQPLIASARRAILPCVPVHASSVPGFPSCFVGHERLHRLLFSGARLLRTSQPPSSSRGRCPTSLVAYTTLAEPTEALSGSFPLNRRTSGCLDFS